MWQLIASIIGSTFSNKLWTILNMHFCTITAMMSLMKLQRMVLVSVLVHTGFGVHSSTGNGIPLSTLIWQMDSKTTSPNRNGPVITSTGHRCLRVLITAVTTKKDHGVGYITQCTADDIGPVPGLNTPVTLPSQHIGDHGPNTTLDPEAQDCGPPILTCLSIELRIIGPTPTGVVGA